MKLRSLALAALLAAPSVSLAEEAKDPNTGALSFGAGFDIVSAYYFRGYLQENQGLIFQPWVEISAGVVSSDDATVGLTLGTWNSFQSENTLSDGDGAGSWYESDIYLKAPMSFGKVSVAPIYTIYLYPNGAFEAIHEIGVKVVYDDTGMIRDGFALKPYVGIYYEFQDDNGSEDGYADVGIEPSWTPPEMSGYQIPALTFPIGLRLSYDDFYVDDDGDNDLLGSFFAGVSTSIPLPLPEEYGAWTLNLGGYYEYLFSDSLEAANNGSEHVFWGKIGVSMAY